MYEGETEPIPRVTDAARNGRARHGRDEPDERDDARDETDRPVGHGHGHGHTPAPPASRRVRTIIAVLLIPFALAAAVGTILLFPFGGSPDVKTGSGTPVHGVVTSASTGACNGDVQVGDQGNANKCLIVTVRMSDGAAPNQEVRTIVPIEPATPRFAVDDKVVLSYAGGNPSDGGSYQLVDFQRGVPIALLAGLFAVAVLVLGRWQGVKALGALVISFGVLVFFVLPAIINGESPLLVGVVGAGVIMFVVLYLTHGLSARTSTAVLGTMVSLTLIGVLGALWAVFAKLTGLDEDTATLVGLLNHSIDTRGLLLAGVVIGALGVLDDITVTQTSAVWELRAANPSLTRQQLYAAALRIGRDHVASAVNTLVMAYAGAALPLLLYSSISGVGLGNILTSQSIAQEIVRTLVGSIGIVAAVPVTTALAAAVAAQEKVEVHELPAEKAPRKKATERRERPTERERAAAQRRAAERDEPADRDESADREPAAGRRRAIDRDEPAGREHPVTRQRAAERDEPAGRDRTSDRERATTRERAPEGERAATRRRTTEREPSDHSAERERAATRRRATDEPSVDQSAERERPAPPRPRPASRGSRRSE